MSLHALSANTIDHVGKALSEYRGKTLLVVNVASRCGFTSQYAALQQVYERYRERGFEVLGFPCNQFGGQEPGTDEEIAAFCSSRYDVTFPLFEKIDVNGESRSPVYAWLTGQETAPDGPGDIRWNFTKFVLGPDGNVLARFSPPTAPDDPALVETIEKSLG